MRSALSFAFALSLAVLLALVTAADCNRGEFAAGIALIAKVLGRGQDEVDPGLRIGPPHRLLLAC